MNSFLETAMAVILVIIVFSIITYVIQELIASNLKYRGKMLQSSIKQLLDGSGLVSTFTTQFYNHPQIKSLKEDLEKLPSYVPSANFALALMDMVAQKTTVANGDFLKDFQGGISSFVQANGDLSVLLKNWSDNSSNSKELQANIEKWYNDYMDRVTGWYKKKSTIITRCIAIGVALFFNLNLIAITKTINSDSTLKASLVNAAETLAKNEQVIKDRYLGTIDATLEKLPQKTQASVDSVLKRYNSDRINSIETLMKDTHVGELPFGWNKKTLNNLGHFSIEEWLLLLLGWFIGAATISMGAPFWFDLLLKIVNVRKAGYKPEEKKQ